MLAPIAGGYYTPRATIGPAPAYACPALVTSIEVDILRAEANRAMYLYTTSLYARYIALHPNLPAIDARVRS